MSLSQAVNPLYIPEILIMIGEFIPIWGWDKAGKVVFLPNNLLPCLSVSRHFRNNLLPVFWYIYDVVAMNTVPFELIQKYAWHIRILNNYARHTRTVICGDRPYKYSYSSPPFSYFEASTNLIEYSGDYGITLDILKQNQNLRRLAYDVYVSIHGPKADPDVFIANDPELYNSFRCLETLNIAGYSFKDTSVIRNILRPIASTLVELHTYDDGFLKGHNDCDDGSDDDDELVLPKLRVLQITLPRVLGTAKNLPKVCPNLEALDNLNLNNHNLNNHNLNNWNTSLFEYIEHDDLEDIFRSRSCPKLNKLNITRSFKDDPSLLNLLNSHPGFHDLGLGILAGSPDCERAVVRHAGTLTSFRLSITGPRWDTSFLFNILKSCGQLTFLHVGHWTELTELLLDRNLWKNPDSLEGLSFSWGECPTILKVHSRPPPAEGTMTTKEQLDAVMCLGWKVHGGMMVHDITFLETMFKLARRFLSLKTISLYGVHYRKIPSSP